MVYDIFVITGPANMIRHLDNATSILASSLLFLTCGLTLADVVGRNIFSQPIPGATELTELALVGITFLIYPRLALRQQHIVIDLLDNFMPTFARRMQQVLTGALGAVLFGAIGWRLVTLAGRAMDYGDQTGYLKLPIYPAFYFMAVMSLITAAVFVATIVLAFTSDSSAFDYDDTQQNPGVE
jgi:TRAP-type transport system small permease protein